MDAIVHLDLTKPKSVRILILPNKLLTYTLKKLKNIIANA